MKRWQGQKVTPIEKFIPLNLQLISVFPGVLS